MHDINTKQSSFTGYLSTFVDVYSDIKELIGSNQLIVSFDSMGGSAVGSIFVYMQQSFGQLPVPTKKGYVFKGWYRNVTKVFNEYLYDEKDLVEDFSYVPDTTHIKLYARWEAKLLRVRFVSSDPDQYPKFSPSALYVKYLTTLNTAQTQENLSTQTTTPLTAVTASLANYKFLSTWNISINQTFVDISAHAEISSINYYGLSSSLNNDKTILRYPVYIARLDDNYVRSDLRELKLTPVDAGKGAIAIGNAEIVGNISGADLNNSGVNIVATITFRQKTANRINDKLSVVFETTNTTQPLFIPNGGNIRELTDEYIEYEADVPFTYKTAGKFYLLVDEETEQITGSNNSVTYKRKTTTDISLCKISIKSLSFRLFEEGISSGKLDDLLISTDDNIVLTANFVPVEYEISFDTYGGKYENENDKFAPLSCKSNETAELPALDLIQSKVTKEGYTATGWSNTPGNPNIITQIIKPTSNKICYIFWQANTYKIIYSYGNQYAEVEQVFKYNSSDYLLPFSSMPFSLAYPQFKGWVCPQLGNKLFKDEQLVNNLTDTNGAILYFKPSDSANGITYEDASFDFSEAKTVYNPNDTFTIRGVICRVKANNSYQTLTNLGNNQNIQIKIDDAIYHEGDTLLYPSFDAGASHKTVTVTFTATEPEESRSYTITLNTQYVPEPNTVLTADTTNFKKVFKPGDEISFKGLKLTAKLVNKSTTGITPSITEVIPLGACEINSLDSNKNLLEPLKQTFDESDIGKRFYYQIHYITDSCSCEIATLVAPESGEILNELNITSTDNSPASYFEDTSFDIASYKISAEYVVAEPNSAEGFESRWVNINAINPNLSYEPKFLQLSSTTAENINISVYYNSNDGLATVSSTINNIEIKPRNIYLSADIVSNEDGYPSISFCYPGFIVDLSSFNFFRRNYEQGMNDDPTKLVTVPATEIMANWLTHDDDYNKGVLTFDNCENGLVFSNNYVFTRNTGITDYRDLSCKINLKENGAVIPTFSIKLLGEDLSTEIPIVVVGQVIPLSSNLQPLLTYRDSEFNESFQIPDVVIDLADVTFVNASSSDGELSDIVVSESDLNGISADFVLNGVTYNGLVSTEVKPVSIEAGLISSDSDREYSVGDFLALSSISADIFLPDFIGIDIFNSSADVSPVMDNISFTTKNNAKLDLTSTVISSDNPDIASTEISGIVITDDVILDGLFIKYNPGNKPSEITDGYVSYNNTELSNDIINAVSSVLSVGSDLSINVQIANITANYTDSFSSLSALTGTSQILISILESTTSDESEQLTPYRETTIAIVDRPTNINVGTISEDKDNNTLKISGASLSVNVNEDGQLSTDDITIYSSFSDDDGYYDEENGPLSDSDIVTLRDNIATIFVGNNATLTKPTVDIDFINHNYFLTSAGIYFKVYSQLSASYKNYGQIGTSFDISKLQLIVSCNGVEFKGTPTNETITDVEGEVVVTSEATLTSENTDSKSIDASLSVYNLGINNDNQAIISETTKDNGIRVEFTATFNGEDISGDTTINSSEFIYQKITAIKLETTTAIEQTPGSTINLDGLQFTLTDTNGKSVALTLSGKLANQI